MMMMTNVYHDHCYYSGYDDDDDDNRGVVIVVVVVFAVCDCYFYLRFFPLTLER